MSRPQVTVRRVGRRPTAIRNSRPLNLGLQHPRDRKRKEREMSQPFEMNTRGFFELAGETFGLLLFGFCFLVLAFCV